METFFPEILITYLAHFRQGFSASNFQRYVLSKVLFSNSASELELEKRKQELEVVFRLAA